MRARRHRIRIGDLRALEWCSRPTSVTGSNTWNDDPASYVWVKIADQFLDALAR